MSRRALILGGSGQIGRAAAACLSESGWTVVSAQRNAWSPTDPIRDGPMPDRTVRTILVDRQDPAALGEAVAEGFDAVIDTVAYDGVHARQWLGLRSHIGALVVISSGSVYADGQGRTLDEAGQTGFPDFPIPIREDQPRAAPGEATYSTRKVEMEDVLLNEASIPVTILRPFAVHGPGNRGPREWWFIARALAGVRSIPLAFDGESRFHTSATANIAELCRVVLEQPGTRVLNAADPTALTVAEIGRAILDALGSDAALEGFSGPPKGLKGRTPWSVERPMIADMSAAEALGYRPVTDYKTAAKINCDALLAAASGRDWLEAFAALSAYPRAMFEPESDG